MDMSDYQELLPAALNLQLQRPLVGRGCFGSVFEAVEERRNGKPSANRVVRFLPPLARDDSLERLQTRLARLSDLRLPGVSTHRDGGIADGRLYLVGDRHERTLDSLLTDDEGRPPDEAWEIVEQLIDGLSALHERGIAHGDLRPRRIFLDDASAAQGRRWEAWIGDPMLGALNWASDGLWVDDDARAYRKQPDQSAKPSPQSDLYALGCIICELVLGRRYNSNRNIDERASQDSIEEVAKKAGSGHELAILAAWLLDSRLTTIADAAELRRQLAKETARRKGRWLSFWAVATTVLAMILTATAFWAMRTKSDADNRRTAVEQELAGFKKTVAELRNSAAEKDRTLDAQKKTILEQSGTIATRDQRIKELEAILPSPSTPSAEEIARNEWSAAVKQRKKRKAHLDELDDFETLCHRWTKMVRDKASAEADPEQVGKHLNQWYKEMRRLLDDAEAWIIADPGMKRKYLEARTHPWDQGKQDAASDGWKGLKYAARVWDEWADDDVLSWAEIHSRASKFQNSKLSAAANLEAKRALQRWLLDMARVGFVLELTNGASKAGYGTYRIATVYTGVDNAHVWPDGGFGHDWPAETGSNYKGKSAVNIAFDWQPGEPVAVWLEGEKAYGVAAHRNLIHKSFDGPLAPYRLHRAGQITSDDGNVTLSFKVQHCPGPPRKWNSGPQDLLKPSPTGTPP